LPSGVLALILGLGPAVYVGSLYLWSDRENREQFHTYGSLLIAVGAGALVIAAFDTQALLGAIAALSAAGAVFAGRLLASQSTAVYQGALATVGLLFLGSLGFGLGTFIDADNAGSDDARPHLAVSAPPPERKTQVKGILLDDAGIALARVPVIITGPTAQTAPITLVTDERGAYSFETASRGVFELNVILEGFEPLNRRLAIGTADLDVGPLTLRARLPGEPTSEVLGTLDPAPEFAVSPTPTPLAVEQPPALATPGSAPRVSGTPTRVSAATATRVVVPLVVATATRPAPGSPRLTPTPSAVRSATSRPGAATPTRTPTGPAR
jgi:hypothetical protein